MANDELMRLAERVENLAWVPGHKHKLDAVVADLRALAQRAPQNGAVPEGFQLVPLVMTVGMRDAGDAAYEQSMRRSRSRNHGVASRLRWEALLAAAPAPEAVMINGLTEAETAATASVMGLKPEAERAKGESVAPKVLKEYWDVRPADPDLHEDIAAMRMALKRFGLLSGNPAPPPAGQPEGVEALAFEAVDVYSEAVGDGWQQPAVHGMRAVVQFLTRRLASAPQSAGSEQRGDSAAIGVNMPTSVFDLARKRIDGGAAQHGQQWVQGARTAINFIEQRLASAQQANTHNKQEQP